MRILHISDLHFGKKYKESIDRMLPSFIQKLKNINEERKINLIIFSGDLVWTGTNTSIFDDAKAQFIEKVINELKLTIDEFMICPGNHDMSRAEEIQAITEYIDKFTTNEELDSFVTKHDIQFDLSYERSKNIYEFMLKIYTNKKVNKLYSSFQMVIDRKKIGIVSFNTAWRSFIGDHHGKLLLPKQIIYEALSEVKGSEILISIMHHPLRDLKEFNRYEIEDIIYENFHINFSGHYHKRNHGIVYTYDVGMLDLSSSATMSGNDGSCQGFSLIDIELDILNFKSSNYSYIKNDNVFVESLVIRHSLPMNEEKSKQVKILKRVKELYQDVMLEADLLLVDYFDSKDDRKFNDVFTTPILKNRSHYESDDKKESESNINCENLIYSNYIIFGKNKYGKTTLLRKIQLDYLANFMDQKIIPIYIDLSDHKLLKSFDLTKELRKMFHLTTKETQRLISDYNIQMFIDSFDPKSESHKIFLVNIINESKKIKFILSSQETQESVIIEFEINGSEFKKIFIHPITRKNIRQHTKKMLVDYDADKQQDVIDNIVQIFNQMSIPFNYWYLSLFLWIYKRQENVNINDNIEMLNLYIDKLLEREEISRYNKNIDYELFKKLLGQLSFQLLKFHSVENYSMTYDELVSFVTEFRERNIRFVTEVKDIIDYILDKGIFKENLVSKKYSFRLTGVMEYFTAFYMIENNSFLDETINSNGFLCFANELEIYAGLKRDDVSLLRTLYEKTEKVVEVINEKFGNNPDAILKNQAKHSEDLAKLISKYNVREYLPLSTEMKDDLLDGERPIKKFNEDTIVAKPQRIEKDRSNDDLYQHVFILSRVFRSLSSVNDLELLDKCFDLIIKSFINITFEFLESLASVESGPEKEIADKLLKLMSNFIPYITQVIISEAVLHKNLLRFLENKVGDLEKIFADNQYKLMILYFMILDINLKQNIGIIDKILANINIRSLKGISALRLLYYLKFRCNGDSNLEEVLKESIIKLQLELFPSSDRSQYASKIDKTIITQKILDRQN